MEVYEVSLPQGVYRGSVINSVRVFKGISYAKAARFARPTPPEKSEIALEATTFGKDCPQFRSYHDEREDNAFYFHEFREGISFRYGEDCLNLNVYAPLSGEKHPIILFFHGGSFIKGSSDEKQVDGTAYAKKGVIFISANYRLNAFGFVRYQGSSANLALWDMLEAIHWVQANGAIFGGDPSHLTLMGQSAGAISIQALLYKPEVRSGVSGAILLSGGGFRNGIFAPHSSRYIDSFSKRMGPDLPSLSAQDFYERYPVLSRQKKTALLAFMPCYDGELIRAEDHQRKAVLPPLIVGIVKHDILLPFLKRAQKRVQAENPHTYTYRFEYDLPGAGKTNFHSCDLWYALGSLSFSSRPFNEKDKELSEKMVSYFAAFAQKSDPNDGVLPPWGNRGPLLF
jgi:carboxylesterase type B